MGDNGVGCILGIIGMVICSVVFLFVGIFWSTYALQDDAVNNGHAIYYKVNNNKQFCWYEVGDTVPTEQIQTVTVVGNEE